MKGLALMMAVVVAFARLAGDTGEWAVPTDHRFSFWLIAAVAAGYVLTAIDRLVDREIVSVVFVVVTLIGYWSLVLVAGLSPWPGGVVRAFALLMAAGDAFKIVYFVTTGAIVRRLPPWLPIVMTSTLIVVQVVVAVAA